MMGSDPPDHPEVTVTDQPSAPAQAGTVRTRRAPSWLNGALTGVVMTSVLVAALDQSGRQASAGEDIAWILILLLCTSLIRGYAAFVAGRAPREPDANRVRSILRTEWPLLVAGVPAVLILLVALYARWPMVVAIHVVLVIDVVILLVLGVVGARKAGYRPASAVAFGIADGVLGALVIVANVFLR
jgi:hypothetical protein